MKSRKRITLLIVSALVAILSCCIIGVGIALANSSDGKYVGEKYAPEITIDYGEFSESNVPNAAINKPYKLFTATAEDLFSKEVYTHVRVWLFYDSATRSLVNIDNGFVTPTNYGVYTVEYTATDRWGNVTQKLYDFKCVEKDALCGEVGSDSNVYDAGSAITVNDVAIKNAIGETSVSAIAVLKSNPEISYPVVKGTFTPLYAGTYDVIYSISDYNEEAESSYSVEVKAHDNIVWQTKLELGTYYLANFDYTLPDVKAFTFGDGTPKEVAITVTATDSTNAKVELENRAFKPQTSGEYTITYKAENAGKTISQTAITTCVDVGVGEKLRVEDYFIGENIQKSLTGNAVILITKTNTSVRFINPICSRTVSMDLSVVKESGDHFDSFDVVLTDATDATKSITMNFAKNGTDNGMFSVSGGRSIKTSEDFYSNGTLVFKFDNIARTAQLGVNQAIAITKTDDGENFEGFSGENVYVDIRFNGVIETAKIRVHRIGNQTIYQDCGDTNAPDIYYAGFGDGDQQIGDIVTLDRIYVADVVCPGVKVEYYVKHQNGKYAKDVNGIELSAQNTDYTQKYQIEMTEYGRYTVTMRVTDLFGNAAAYTYNFSCVNLQSVKIEILDDQSESAKLGETVTIKSFQVPNFEMDELVVRIFIKDPEGVMKQVIDNVFVPDLRGEYVVTYYVTDVDGNMDMASYTVKVS